MTKRRGFISQIFRRLRPGQHNSSERDDAHRQIDLFSGRVETTIGYRHFLVLRKAAQGTVISLCCGKVTGISLWLQAFPCAAESGERKQLSLFLSLSSLPPTLVWKDISTVAEFYRFNRYKCSPDWKADSPMKFVLTACTHYPPAPPAPETASRISIAFAASNPSTIRNFHLRHAARPKLILILTENAPTDLQIRLGAGGSRR